MLQLRASMIYMWIISVHVHCEAKKTAPFYYLNNFVKSRSILIIFGTQTPAWICKNSNKIIHRS